MGYICFYQSLDYYITQYQDSKFKKTSAKDDNKSDNSFIYFYDDKGKVIFTIVNANLLKDYYYLVPGEFESYTGLQLYKKVEQENFSGQLRTNIPRTNNGTWYEFI